MASPVSTYLSQEGFVDTRGVWYSRELNVTIRSTYQPNFFDVIADEHTYRNIRAQDLQQVVDACHQYSGTALLVTLYNLQLDVLNNQQHKIKEDI